jgi:hypothetical protein
VALLAGGLRPVIVRHGDDGHWRYIASARVHGIIKGEAWPTDKDVDELETFVPV